MSPARCVLVSWRGHLGVLWETPRQVCPLSINGSAYRRRARKRKP